MRFAMELNLPVPHVYESKTDEPGEENRIEMGFVEGERLDKVWPSLTDEQKTAICQDLRQILAKMRSAPHDKQPIGSLRGGEAQDIRSIFDYTGGPFSNEAGFNDFYLDLVKLIPKPIYRALHHELRQDHRIVFTHGDLSQHNILVKDNRVAGLLDWETGGWYPEHWDYIKFFDRPASQPDWANYADLIFPQSYEQELALHQAVIRWQRP